MRGGGHLTWGTSRYESDSWWNVILAREMPTARIASSSATPRRSSLCSTHLLSSSAHTRGPGGSHTAPAPAPPPPPTPPTPAAAFCAAAACARDASTIFATAASTTSSAGGCARAARSATCANGEGLARKAEVVGKVGARVGGVAWLGVGRRRRRQRHRAAGGVAARLDGRTEPPGGAHQPRLPVLSRADVDELDARDEVGQHLL